MAIAHLYSPTHELSFDARSVTQAEIVIPAFFSVSAECTIFEPDTLTDVTPRHWGSTAMKGYLLEMGGTQESGTFHILSGADYATFAFSGSHREVRQYDPVARIRIPEDQKIVHIARRTPANMLEVGAIRGKILPGCAKPLTHSPRRTKHDATYV